MKKLSLLLAILMIAAMFSSFAYAVDDTQATAVARENGVVHAIKRTNPITIDGLIGSNEDWNKAEINEFTIASGKIEVRFRAMWDEDYVYLLYEVKDPTMVDDNGAYENSISKTYNAIDTAATGASGVVYDNVAQFFIKCDSIGFAFDPSGANASVGAPAFTGYAGLYGAVGKRTLVWDDTFYSVATKEDGTTKYYESWFKSSIVRDSEDKAIGYIMEGKVDLKQHGENFSNPDLCPTNYAKYGYTGLTYDVGSKFSFGAYVNNVETVGTREAIYAWPTAMNTGSTMTGWGTMELVAADAVVDNGDIPSVNEFFGCNVIVESLTATPDPTKPQTYALKTSGVTIDGKIDAEWEKAQINEMDFAVNNAGAFLFNDSATSTIDARFRVMWDEDYLYFLYEVVDTSRCDAYDLGLPGGSIFYADIVMFSFDPNYVHYTNGSTKNDGSGYFYRTATGRLHNGGYGWLGKDSTTQDGIYHSNKEFAVGWNDGNSGEYFATNFREDGLGYVMEGKVAIPNISNVLYDKLTAGRVIGFNSIVSDGVVRDTAGAGKYATNGKRTAQVGWSSGDVNNRSLQGAIILTENAENIDNTGKVTSDVFFKNLGNLQAAAFIVDVQKSKVVDEKYSLRFVAKVKNPTNYSSMTLKIGNGTTVWETSKNKDVFYTALNEYRDIEAVPAEDGFYYVSYVIYDIPVDATGTFTIVLNATVGSQTVALDVESYAYGN